MAKGLDGVLYRLFQAKAQENRHTNVNTPKKHTEKETEPNLSGFEFI